MTATEPSAEGSGFVTLWGASATLTERPTAAEPGEARGVHRPLRLPDGEFTGSGRIITAMQDVGFDVRHSENLREHYALTLRGWCANLRDNWDECVVEVGEGTARVWGLYMGASRLSFERNQIQLHQVLVVKPAEHGDTAVPLRPWWVG